MKRTKQSTFARRERSEKSTGFAPVGGEDMTHTTKHTPGPWYRNIPPANKYTTVWSGRNKHVAYIKQMPDDVEAEANINLIAAAPAMYEALQIMVRAANVDEIDPLAMFASIERAKAALELAEGR